MRPAGQGSWPDGPVQPPAAGGEQPVVSKIPYAPAPPPAVPWGGQPPSQENAADGRQSSPPRPPLSPRPRPRRARPGSAGRPAAGFLPPPARPGGVRRPVAQARPDGLGRVP